MKIDLRKMMLLLFYPVEFLLIDKIMIPRIEFFIGTFKVCVKNIAANFNFEFFKTRLSYCDFSLRYKIVFLTVKKVETFFTVKKQGTIIIFVLSMVLFVRHSFKRIVIKRLFIYIMSIGLISFLSTFIFANHRISIAQQLLWLKNIYTYAFVFIFVVCSLVVNLPAYGILIILDKYTIKAKE